MQNKQTTRKPKMKIEELFNALNGLIETNQKFMIALDDEMQEKFYAEVNPEKKAKIKADFETESRRRADEVKDLLVSNGFKLLGRGKYNRAFKGKLEKKELVVKYSLSGNTGFPKASDFERFPALAKRTIMPLFHSKSVTIQEKVKRRQDFIRKGKHAIKRFRQATQAMENRFEKLYGRGFDSHEGNIGFVNGKFMNFDPMVGGGNIFQMLFGSR